MNSTKFFKKWLRPLSKNYFPKGFDKSATSYFITRKTPKPVLTSFTNLEETLGCFWETSGNPELKPLAKPMAELAKNVYAIENQSDEVSPFIYVMY